MADIANSNVQVNPQLKWLKWWGTALCVYSLYNQVLKSHIMYDRHVFEHYDNCLLVQIHFKQNNCNFQAPFQNNFLLTVLSNTNFYGTLW